MPEMDSYQLAEALIRIETKLDNLNTTYHEHLTDHSDHETRLRSLEKKIWSLPSLATIIAVASVAVQYFVH